MKDFDPDTAVEVALADWRIVLHPLIYRCIEAPEAVFARLACAGPIALYGRTRNDPRYNPATGAYADGHRIVTSPITKIEGGKFYTRNSVYTVDESQKNAAYKTWCEANP